METWLPHEELRDLHILYLFKPSHKDYHLYLISNAPLCGNLYLTSLFCKLLAPFACFGFVPIMCLYMLCLILAYLVYSSMFGLFGTSCTCVFCFEPLMHLDDILFGSFQVINGTSHFGGVICLAHLSFLKMCVHEYYHLVLILQDYLVTMWCVILMRIQIIEFH